jgi:hypothetical protein
MHSSPSTTSRQRVLQARAHRQPDRVPRDLGGTTATGINIVEVEAYRWPKIDRSQPCPQ